MDPAALKIHNIRRIVQSCKDEKCPKGFVPKRFSEPCLIFNLSYQTNVISSQSSQTDPSSRYKKEGHFLLNDNVLCVLYKYVYFCLKKLSSTSDQHHFNLFRFLHNLSDPCNINI